MSSTSEARGTPGEICIEVRGLALGYDESLVLREIGFRVRRRSIFIVMGESGCGKSTLMRAMIGLLPPRAGEIYYGGSPFWATDPRTRQQIQCRFGVLFQSGALWSSLTIGENVALPLRRHTSLEPREIADLVAFKLALVGLGGREELYPHELSGGMRKRAGIARALALDPELVFLDEPSAGLDPLTARKLDELILELRDSLDITFVVVTHELASLLTIGDDSIFLDADTRTALASGPPRRLAREGPPKVRAFLTRGADAAVIPALEPRP